MNAVGCGARCAMPLLPGNRLDVGPSWADGALADLTRALAESALPLAIGCALIVAVGVAALIIERHVGD